MLGEPGVTGTILEPLVNRVLSKPNFVCGSKFCIIMSCIQSGTSLVLGLGLGYWGS